MSKFQGLVTFIVSLGAIGTVLWSVGVEMYMAYSRPQYTWPGIAVILISWLFVILQRDKLPDDDNPLTKAIRNQKATGQSLTIQGYTVIISLYARFGDWITHPILAGAIATIALYLVLEWQVRTLRTQKEQRVRYGW